MTPIAYEVGSAFFFTLIGLFLFFVFLVILWIIFRLICWPIQMMWYAIKNLIDNT